MPPAPAANSRGSAQSKIQDPKSKISKSIFDVIREQDVMLHHPYDSFAPVVDFVSQAARDPQVFAIKQTLYRTSGDSPLVSALIEASRNGKQVAALVELKARFDEANNIQWARRLEEAGVHVVYGLVGHKTHCKCSLVVRREGGALHRYAHLGTGNYNPTTARLYTDLSLFTAREHITADIANLFNTLTGFSLAPAFNHILVAPFGMHEQLQELIRQEAENAKAGRPARIIAKMNSLVDPTTIDNLQAASRAGVKIDLIVRGICCLIPGIRGRSENIRVRSIVGRYLEHARVFYFENNAAAAGAAAGESDAGAAGEPLIYAGSADWMPRNFFRRVEVLFPIESPALRAWITQVMLPTELRDNENARELRSNGTYAAVAAQQQPAAVTPLFSAQNAFMENAIKRAAAAGGGGMVNGE
jgi:polyphosphate kinase